MLTIILCFDYSVDFFRGKTRNLSIEKKKSIPNREGLFCSFHIIRVAYVQYIELTSNYNS